MKTKTLICAITGCMLFTGCSTNPSGHSVEYKPYLNQSEITGLETLGDDLSTLRLNYALDSTEGKEVNLNSCDAVNSTSASNINTSQHHLLQLTKVNCTAAEYYFNALKQGNTPSFLPHSLTAEFIKTLPAQAVPNLGGEPLKNRNGTLIEAEKNLTVLSVDNGVVEVSLSGDVMVNYVTMARGDFNNDGIEDMLLRLDWHISSAFGKGFDLLMVTQTGKSTRPSLIWRK